VNNGVVQSLKIMDRDIYMVKSRNYDQSYADHIKSKTALFQSFLKAKKLDGILVSSGSLEPIFQDDYYHPFVVNPYFKEWLPLLNVANCFVFIPIEGRPQLLFNQPVDIWHKVAAVPEAFWVPHFEITVYSNDEQCQLWLDSLEGDVSYIGREASFPKGLASSSRVNCKQTLAFVNYQRAYKSQYEIDSVDAANELAAIAHIAAKDQFYQGGSEYQINQSYLQSVKVREAELPYGNIVALNANGAILHYTHLDTAAIENRSFLIDAGYSVNGYAADISRSYCNDKTAAGKLFSSLIDALNKAQLDLIATMKSGAEYLQLHIEMHRRIADILFNSGVITVGTEIAVESGLTSVFYPHGLGHLLGLQVHDLGGWQQDDQGSEKSPPAEHPYLRLNRKLEVGMVITVEPGIYFIDALLDQWHGGEFSSYINWEAVDSLKPYGGIRIEDNIVIEADGTKNLTRQYLP